MWPEGLQVWPPDIGYRIQQQDTGLIRIQDTGQSIGLDTIQIRIQDKYRMLAGYLSSNITDIGYVFLISSLVITT